MFFTSVANLTLSLFKVYVSIVYYLGAFLGCQDNLVKIIKTKSYICDANFDSCHQVSLRDTSHCSTINAFNTKVSPESSESKRKRLENLSFNKLIRFN